MTDEPLRSLVRDFASLQAQILTLAVEWPTEAHQDDSKAAMRVRHLSKRLLDTIQALEVKMEAIYFHSVQDVNRMEAARKDQPK